MHVIAEKESDDRSRLREVWISKVITSTVAERQLCAIEIQRNSP